MDIRDDSFSFIPPRPHLISYGTYLKTQYPKKQATELQDKEKRVIYNRDIKYKIGSITDSFIKQGQPGHLLQKHFNAIMNHLAVPSSVIEDLNSNESQYHSIFKDIYKNNNYHILLSLFFLMIKLTQQGRDFALVFRSFGQDIKNVMTEFNEFCKGNHPLFNGRSEHSFPRVKFDGTDGSKNYMLSYEQIGVVYRSSDRIEDITVVIGTLERKDKVTKDFAEAYKDSIDKDRIRIINGGIGLYHYLLSNINNEIRACALSDSFFPWFENDERSLYSKPLLIDPYDESIHQIFFDDNINHCDTFSIVDCRNVVTGRQIGIKDSWNKYIVQVDTLSAVVDHDYFYKCVERAEELRRNDFDKDQCGETSSSSETIVSAHVKAKINSVIEDAIRAYGIEKDYKDLGEFIGKYIIVYKDKVNK